MTLEACTPVRKERAMRFGLRHGLAVAGAAAAVATTLVLVPGAHAAITASSLVNPVSGKCLDVAGPQVDISTCTGAANQAWTSTPANELRVTVAGATKCLDASGAGTANGTRLVVSTCSGAASQKWNLKSNSTITGVPSGKCVDVRGNGTANGTIVELWSCKTAGNNNQRWTPGSGGNPSPSATPSVSTSPTGGGGDTTCAVKSRPSGKVLQGYWENWDGSSNGVHPPFGWTPITNPQLGSHGYNVINAAFPVIRSDGTVLWEDGMDAGVKVATPAEMCQAKQAGATTLMPIGGAPARLDLRSRPVPDP